MSKEYIDTKMDEIGDCINTYSPENFTRVRTALSEAIQKGQEMEREKWSDGIWIANEALPKDLQNIGEKFLTEAIIISRTNYNSELRRSLTPKEDSKKDV